MNPFENKVSDHIDLVDDPNGQRVMLECQKCGVTVYEGKYWPEFQMLSWKCPNEHLSKQGFVME